MKEKTVLSPEKLFIILYGSKNQGKSTTLRELVILLGGGSPTLENDLKSFLLVKKRYKDAHFIIEYENHIIHISTGGDSWSVCRGNTQFFEGNYNGNQEIYLVTGGKIKMMSKTDKQHYRKIQPEVVVSACRPDADSYGAIKALHYYSEHHLMDYVEQVWIKRDKIDEPDSKKIANILKSRIDDFIK